ncbi:MAG: SRPBCC family protein [Pyrinomonadaceae bacterium]
MLRVERFVEVEAPVERVFDAFSDFGNVPRWMDGIEDVRPTGRRRTHWRSRRGAGLEWQVETTVFEPDHRVAWRSVGGDVLTDGEAIFEETRRGTTVVRAVIGYEPAHDDYDPRGAGVELFGRGFAQVLEEDLERFKEMVEHHARSGARRGAEASGERRFEGRERFREQQRDDERVPRSDARYSERVLGMRGRDEDDRKRNEGRRFDAPLGDHRDTRDRERSDDAGRFDDVDKEMRRSRNTPERDFDETLRAARQSQTEGMRRYREEREQEERRRATQSEPGRVDSEHEDERRSAEERRRQIEDKGSDNGPPQYRPRYALTPREREREDRQRDEDDGESSLRRGVDRLLDDEPPSERWRR